MSREPFDLEAALRQALRPEDPPDAFSRRVLERVAARRRRVITHRWLAIAAMLVLTVFAAAGVRQVQARREAEARQAGHDLVVALKITGHKLHATQQMIRRRSNGA